MNNLTGITLNGEWLGNNVLINGMFKTICSMSPSLMQEFIHIINGIDELDNAVAIQNFNCKDKNSIDIEFGNNSLKGLASLYYADNGDSKEVLNSFLKLNRDEGIENFMAKDTETDSIEGKHNRAKKSKSRRKNRNNKTITGDVTSIDEYSEDEYYNEEDGDFNENNDQEMDDYYDSPDEYNEEYSNSEYQPGSYDGYGEYAEDIDGSSNTRRRSQSRNKDSYQEGNITSEGGYCNTDYDRAENEYTDDERFDENNREDYVNDSMNADSIDTQFDNEMNSNRAVSESGRSRAPQQKGMREHRSDNRRGNRQGMSETQGRVQGRTQGGRVTASSDLQQIVITAKSINITPSDFDESSRSSGRNRDRVVQESDETTGSRRNRNTESVCDDKEVKPESHNEIDGIESTQTCTNEQQGHIIIPEIINENYNPEDISEFLADFYTSDKIEAEITREQALLDEIASLKEEINTLHGQHRNEGEEEETPMTLEEFYARQLKKKESKANTYGYTFKIVSTQKRIRANVVNPELFIAGDKLYRWGEKLYLEY